MFVPWDRLGRICVLSCLGRSSGFCFLPSVFGSLLLGNNGVGGRLPGLGLSAAVGVVVGLLPRDSDTDAAAVVGSKVWDTGVEGGAVVPDGDTVGLPVEAHLVLELDGDEVVDVVKNPLGLLGSDFVDLASKDRVGVDRLPAGDGVGADDWVDRVVELTKGLEAVVGDLDLEDVRTVGGGQAFEQIFDGLRKVIVELVTVGPDGVAARLGDLLKLED